MPNGVSVLENEDLSGDYYTSAMPVIEEQIAKAGYRYVTSCFPLNPRLGEYFK